MNKLLLIGVISTSLVFSSIPKYSTTAVVTLVGAKIAASNIDKPVEKYKREDCPVCKGKGWYISGDNLAKVDCVYCEEETKEEPEPVVVEKVYADPPLVPIPRTNPTIRTHRR